MVIKIWIFLLSCGIYLQKFRSPFYETQCSTMHSVSRKLHVTVQCAVYSHYFVKSSDITSVAVVLTVLLVLACCRDCPFEHWRTRVVDVGGQ